MNDWVVCPQCGHEWARRTRSLVVKCPWCGKNFRLDYRLDLPLPTKRPRRPREVQGG